MAALAASPRLLLLPSGRMCRTVPVSVTYRLPPVIGFASVAQGVGTHKPESVALVGGANVGSSQHSPAAVIPERGQITEHSSKSPSKEGWAVLHVDVSRSNLANDPRHVSPHAAAGTVNAGSLACDADVLARKAARYDVNTACPLSAVKGSHVIPDRKRFQDSVVLSRHKYACCVGVVLDGTHGSPAEQESAKYSAACSCEQGKLA
jgi:hypothetical protein